MHIYCPFACSFSEAPVSESCIGAEKNILYTKTGGISVIYSSNMNNLIYKHQAYLKHGTFSPCMHKLKERWFWYWFQHYYLAMKQDPQMNPFNTARMKGTLDALERVASY